jgi:hypothetical protein
MEERCECGNFAAQGVQHRQVGHERTLNACNIGRADDPDIDGTITLKRQVMRYSFSSR